MALVDRIREAGVAEVEADELVERLEALSPAEIAGVEQRIEGIATGEVPDVLRNLPGGEPVEEPEEEESVADAGTSSDTGATKERVTPDAGGGSAAPDQPAT